MAFCPNCGAQVNGSFCGNCGATMNAGQAPGAGPQQPQYQQQAQGAGMTQNTASALCYLLGFITGIIFLVLTPYNNDPKIKYHAWQSIGFHVGMIVIWMLMMILTAVTGGLLGVILFPLVGLGAFVLWLFLMFKAYQGEGIHLPLIGDFAKKQAGL